MDAIPIILSGYLDSNGSMFNCYASFFIIKPRDNYTEQTYAFSKVALDNKSVKKIDNMPLKQQNDKMQSFVGSKEEVNDNRHFDWDSFSQGDQGVVARLYLDSFNDDNSFTVKISVLHKNGHSLLLRYEGEAPSWLSTDGIAGRLYKGSLVKIPRPKKP